MKRIQGKKPVLWSRGLRSGCSIFRCFIYGFILYLHLLGLVFVIWPGSFLRLPVPEAWLRVSGWDLKGHLRAVSDSGVNFHGLVDDG